METQQCSCSCSVRIRSNYLDFVLQNTRLDYVSGSASTIIDKNDHNNVNNDSNNNKNDHNNDKNDTNNDKYDNNDHKNENTKDHSIHNNY